MKCTVHRSAVPGFWYKGKQVRDNIHSHDLVSAFWEFFRGAAFGEVYNMGGSRHSNCSMIEAIRLCEEISGRKLRWTYSDQNRKGDHIWWISDVRKFRSHFPEWEYRFSLRDTIQEIFKAHTLRRQAAEVLS